MTFLKRSNLLWNQPNVWYSLKLLGSSARESWQQRCFAQSESVFVHTRILCGSTCELYRIACRELWCSLRQQVRTRTLSYSCRNWKYKYYQRRISQLQWLLRGLRQRIDLPLRRRTVSRVLLSYIWYHNGRSICLGHLSLNLGKSLPSYCAQFVQGMTCAWSSDRALSWKRFVKYQLEALGRLRWCLDRRFHRPHNLYL